MGRRLSRRSGFWNGRAKPSTLEQRREAMVKRQIERRGIRDERILAAMREVPRHLFVPAEELSLAYEDYALPLTHGQTISQPYIVAFMAAAVKPEEGLRVLEVGAGSGYQAAVLAALGMKVFGIERLGALVDSARANLLEAGYADRVKLRLGDGCRGWPEEAPFDRILISAATETVPDALVEQLRVGGVLVAPVGGYGYQRVRRYVKLASGVLEEESLIGARFVPLVPGPTEGDWRPDPAEDPDPDGGPERSKP